MRRLGEAVSACNRCVLGDFEALAKRLGATVTLRRHLGAASPEGGGDLGYDVIMIYRTGPVWAGWMDALTRQCTCGREEPKGDT